MMLTFTYLIVYKFFFNDTPTTEIYTCRHTLSRHDARPILAFAAIAQGYGAAPCPASICTPRSGVPGSTSRLSPWRLESGRSASYDHCEALRADRKSTRLNSSQ